MRRHPLHITKPSNAAGFTLMEVMVALVILSTSIYILLGHHYSIMGLQQTISDELVYNQLVETAVAKAELGVLMDKMADAGDFGERFAEYTWQYEAVLSGADPLVPLYAINLTINAPEDSRTYKFFFYNTGNPESSGEGRLDPARRGAAGAQGAGRMGTGVGAGSALRGGGLGGGFGGGGIPSGVGGRR